MLDMEKEKGLPLKEKGSGLGNSSIWSINNVPTSFSELTLNTHFKWDGKIKHIIIMMIKRNKEEKRNNGLFGFILENTFETTGDDDWKPLLEKH